MELLIGYAPIPSTTINRELAKGQLFTIRSVEVKDVTSLSLDRLREVAGAFISESDFQLVELQYKDYIAEYQYDDNECVAEQFCEEWLEEQELLGTFGVTTDGNIKYYVMDGVDDVPFTTSEFLVNQDMNSYHWENLCRSYWEIFREMLETGEINMKLLTNILNEVKISHEQIYQLLGGMKALQKTI